MRRTVPDSIVVRTKGYLQGVGSCYKEAFLLGTLPCSNVACTNEDSSTKPQTFRHFCRGLGKKCVVNVPVCFASVAAVPQKLFSVTESCCQAEMEI